MQQASLKCQLSALEFKLRRENYKSICMRKMKNIALATRWFFFKKTCTGRPICVVWNCCFYHRSVILNSGEKVSLLDQNSFYFVESYNGNFYICKTWSTKIKKDHTPYQVVCNKLEINGFSENLKNIRKLEKVFIAKRVLFKKLHVMHKGQSLKIRGAISNVPIDTIGISNTLPRQADSNGLIIVKLKRNLERRGHYSVITVLKIK